MGKIISTIQMPVRLVPINKIGVVEEFEDVDTMGLYVEYFHNINPEQFHDLSKEFYLTDALGRKLDVVIEQGIVMKCILERGLGDD